MAGELEDGPWAQREDQLALPWSTAFQLFPPFFCGWQEFSAELQRDELKTTALNH